MSGRPKRACDKCSSQKLRCSGQRPSCQRCLRLRRPCVYNLSTSFQITPAAASIPSSVSEKTYIGIPSALVGPLVETYFNHIYHAPLLLHQPTLEQEIASNTVSPDILLSICAFAAKFHRDAQNRLVLLDNGFYHEWAERASRLAFEQAQFAQEHSIITLLTLALFWFSEGEFRRSSMHECCATNSAMILGLSTARTDGNDPLKGELKRRRFWACFLLSAYQSKALLPLSLNEQVLSLSLPCREDDYQIGIPRDLETLQSQQSTGSVFAELVKGTTMWMAVRRLVNQPVTNWPSHLASLQALDSQINDWYIRFHPGLNIHPSKAPSTITPHILLIHILYHTCLCALHSSIVPVFSWRTNDGPSDYVQQLSAQSAFQNANAISALLAMVQNGCLSPSRLAGFVGYSAYCACAVQMPFLWCIKPDVQMEMQSNIQINLNIIQRMGEHWRFAELLGRNIKKIFQLHARKPLYPPAEPVHMDPSLLRCPITKAERASLSVLTYNQIIVGEEGIVAEKTEDVENLELEDESLFTEPIATNNMMPSDGDQSLGGLDPCAVGLFQFLEDQDLFVTGLSFTDMENSAEQVERLDDWMEEFLGGHVR